MQHLSATLSGQGLFTTALPTAAAELLSFSASMAGQARREQFTIEAKQALEAGR
jgi:hypothetical protein